MYLFVYYCLVFSFVMM